MLPASLSTLLLLTLRFQLRRKYALLFADRSKELSNQVLNYLIPCAPKMPPVSVVYNLLI
nr:MAG TPA: hypothetical protein [Caudoviricetes sp.]